MKIPRWQAGLVLGFIFLNLVAATTSQVNTYVNGNVLTANQLNSEFSNIYSTINNLDEDNLSDSTSLEPTKISSSIDGDGISRQADGSLDVNVDGSTVTIVSDQLVIDDLPGSAILNGGVDTAQIADEAVTKAKEEIKTLAATASAGDVGESAGSGASLVTLTTSSTGTLSGSTLTLTTLGGPVMLMVAPDTAASDSYIECEDSATDPCKIAFDRGGTDLVTNSFVGEGGTTRYPPGGFTFVDTPSAGTYTYRIDYDVGSATELRALNVKLIAYEL